MKVRAAVFLCFLACYASWIPAQDMKIRPEAYIDQEGIWANGNVPVCWVNPAGFSEQISWVETAVITHIEGLDRDVSGVRFLGTSNQRQPWGACVANSNGIRIRIANEWPRSNVGQQWERDASGAKIRENEGRYRQLPTLMVLNLALTSGFSCEPKKHCIEAVAVHEFLHAIGFLHEQLRPDAPKWCRDRYAGHKDAEGLRPVPGTPQYDQDSHTNYCDNMYRMPIRLSQGDREALRKFYPLR